LECQKGGLDNNFNREEQLSDANENHWKFSIETLVKCVVLASDHTTQETDHWFGEAARRGTSRTHSFFG
jgi:hypothetical protein